MKAFNMYADCFTLQNYFLFSIRRAIIPIFFNNFAGGKRTDSTMNLTIDIGNTCTKLVAFDGDEPVGEMRMDDGELHKFDGFCAGYPFERGICSSVVDVPEGLRRRLEAAPFPVMRLVSGVTPVPVNNRYATPLTLGTDRLAAVVGAHFKSGGRDVLVIDVGTCITYDFITAAGDYLGGNISPGPTMRLKALGAFAGALPVVDRKGDTPPMGYSTETAIRSGVMRGVTYEIESYIRDFILKCPGLFVYLTGGVQLDLHIPEKKCIFADNFIVPYGLNRILLYNEEIAFNEKNSYL